jgi:hypothetical protein
MSVGGRDAQRKRYLRRVGLTAGALVLLALLLFASGHWLVGLVLAAAAVAAIFVYAQMRTVR